MSGTALVVGGGVVGCASALELARRGWRVTLLEQARTGAGCSHGNCGYISPSHVDPLCVPGAVRRALVAKLHGSTALTIPLRADPTLARWLWRFRGHCNVERAAVGARARDALLKSSRLLYDRHFEESPLDPEEERRGLLLVYRSERDFRAHAATARRLGSEYGIETEEIDAERLSTFEPALVDGLAGGWWYPGDAHAQPDRVVALLRERAESAGVEFREGCRVESIEPATAAGSEVWLHTTAGEFAADAVVLATGAMAPLLARRFGVDLGIIPGKGYSVTFPATEGTATSAMPRVPLVLEEHHVAVTPFRTALRVGSTMELTGYDRTVRPERIALLRRSAAEHLRARIGTPIIEEWCGWRPMSSDDVPSIGAVPEADGVYVAAGNGMIGLSTAPATGRLVAELVSGETPHVDPGPYRPGRFGGRARFGGAR